MMDDFNQEVPFPQPQVSPPTYYHRSSRRLKILIIGGTLVFIFILFLFSGVILLTRRQPPSSQNQKNPPQTSSTPTPGLISEPGNLTDSADWKTFDGGQESGYSFMYPSDWIFVAESEGCGPSFYPPNTRKIWLTVCGPYQGADNTPEKLAKNAIGDKIVQSKGGISLDNYPGIRQELLSNNNYYLDEISVYVGKVPYVATFEDGGVEQRRGTIGIYFYIQDKTQLAKAKELFSQILPTFKFPVQDSVTCIGIDNNPPELTFEAAYCNGTYCSDAVDKDDCELRDMIKIRNNKIISGQDGQADCKWDTDQNICFPNR